MRIITLDVNKKIIDEKNVNDDYVNEPGLKLNEIISDLGEVGQVQQADGSFVTPAPIVVPQLYQPTNAEVAQMISELQADLVIAGVI